MKNHTLILLLSGLSLNLIFTSCNENQAPENNPNEEIWTPLFDGTGMQDWTPKFAGAELGVNVNNRFVYQDSFLSVRYTETDTFKADFGHLFFKDKFSYYKIRATYRFVKEQQLNGPGWAYRNNGLMLHCQPPKTMGVDQDFPICIEMQLLGGNGTDPRPTANLCTPGSHVTMHDSLFTPHCVESTSKTYHGDQWVTVDVLVLGDSLIRHIVEDQVVMEYSTPVVGGAYVSANNYAAEGTPMTEGYISIQAETAPIDFKSISVLDLCGCMDKKAKNYKSYFVKADNTKCRY